MDAQVALPLDISAATSTLEDALRAFATPERLVGDNAYRWVLRLLRGGECPAVQVKQDLWVSSLLRCVDALQ